MSGANLPDRQPWATSLDPEIWNEDQPIVSLRGIRRSFFTGGETSEVLRGVDLDIYRGQFVVIRGESGSGKTTLLRILGLLDQEFEGTYTLGNVPVKGRPDWWLDELRAQNMGFVFQEGRLFDHLSLKDNVLVALRLRGAKDEYTHEISLSQNHYFEDWELNKGLLSQSASSASGGQRQRAAIWRALSINPPIILADEPTASLDAERKIKIRQLLEDANAQGVTVIVVSHDNIFHDAGLQYDMVNGELINRGDLLRGAASSAPVTPEVEETFDLPDPSIASGSNFDPRDWYSDEPHRPETRGVHPERLREGVSARSSRTRDQSSPGSGIVANAPMPNPASPRGEAGSIAADQERRAPSNAPHSPRIPAGWGSTLGGWRPRATLATLAKQTVHETFSRPIFLMVVLVALIAGAAQITVFLSLLLGTQDFIDHTIKEGSRLNRVEIKPKMDNRAKDDRFPDRASILAFPKVESVVGRRESNIRFATGPEDTTPYVAMGLHDNDPEYKLLYFLSGGGFSAGAQDLEVIVTQALIVDLEITPPVTESDKGVYQNYIGRYVGVEVPTFFPNGRKREQTRVMLKIVGVISKAEGGRQAYLPNQTLMAFDRYKRDRTGAFPLPVTADGTAWSMPPEEVQNYANFPWEDRLHIYTKAVRDVIPVFAQVAEAGYRPQSDIWDFKWVLDIQDMAWKIFIPLLSLILLVVALTVATNIFYSAKIRIKEFALWRIIGMRMGDLALTQVASTIIMVALGALIGVGLGMVLLEQGRILLRETDENTSLDMILAPVLSFLPYVILGAIILGIFAAIGPSRQAGRTNPAKILQSN